MRRTVTVVLSLAALALTGCSEVGRYQVAVGSGYAYGSGADRVEVGDRIYVIDTVTGHVYDGGVSGDFKGREK